MTLGEGKKKVLMLMDEYSSGGALTLDRDIEAKMAAFFDLAQKNVCQYKHLVKSYVPDETGAAPADLNGAFRVWRDGKLTTRYPWRGKVILLQPEDVGRVTVEYFAIPETIPEGAEDDYKFQADEDAAACMPYFVAAQQLMADLILDPAPLLEMYDRMVSALDVRLPGSGSTGIRQSFYR